MDIGLSTTLLAGDPRLVDHIVGQVKSQGIFDQFRKECIADVDTKPAYQNLRTRVEGSVNSFLKSQVWKPDMNKNQLRETLRKHIHEASFLDVGVERIVDQVVNPKIYSVFMPQIEDVVYKFLGMERPKPREKNGACILKDLLPKDLDPVSPESDRNSLKEESLESMDISFEDNINGRKENILEQSKPQTSKTVSNIKIESEIKKEEDNRKVENLKNIEDTKKIEESIKLDDAKKIEETKKLEENKKLKEIKKEEEEIRKEEEIKSAKEIKNGQFNIDENSMDGFEKTLTKTVSTSNLNASFRSDDKTEEEEESPQFEPIDIMNLNESNLSNDSHLSGISELTSHRSRTPDYNDFSRDNFEFSNHDQDSQLSKVSSNSRLSIVTDFGSSNQPSTPFFNSNEDSKDNFKIIRDIEEGKYKETKFNFDGIKSKANLQEKEKDSKSIKSLSSKENSRDETDGVLREKSESKDMKEKSENRDLKEKSESRDGKERSESKDRKERSESKDRKERSESKDRKETSESKDRKERSESKDRKERSESKDRKERSESKDRKERSESKDRKERSESKDRKERSESKDRKERSESKDRREKGESSKSRKDKSDSRDSRRHKDKKKQSSSSSSRHSKSRKENEHSKEKRKDTPDKTKESSSKDKNKEERKEKEEKDRDEKKEKEERKERDEKKDQEKQEGSQDIKDLKDIYKEKIREWREKKELTEKEKLNKDSKDKKDSSRDKKDYKKDHRTSKSSDRHDKSSKTKSSDSKDSKDKKRDDRRHSKDSRSRSSRSEKESRSKKEERNDKSDSKKESKSESQSSKEKKQRDDKKSKTKDDHSSLKKNSSDRRSTDRDGSNGSNGKSSQKSTSSGTKSVSTTLAKEANNTNTSSGDTSEGIEDSQGNDKLMSSEFESQPPQVNDESSTTTNQQFNPERENYLKADGNSKETCLPLKKRPLHEDSSSPSSSSEPKAKKPKLEINSSESKNLTNLEQQTEKSSEEDLSKIKKVESEKEKESSNSPLPVEDITKVPDEERVQIIEVPDEESEEPYSDKITNLTLQETAMIILQAELVGQSDLIHNNQKKESKLSVMEESIRKSLDEMMSDKKLVESSDPVANIERAIETEDQKDLKEFEMFEIGKGSSSSEKGSSSSSEKDTENSLMVSQECKEYFEEFRSIKKSSTAMEFEKDKVEENLEKLERGDFNWDDICKEDKAIKLNDNLNSVPPKVDSNVNKIEETRGFEKITEQKEKRPYWGKDDKILSTTLELRVSMGIKRSTEDLIRNVKFEHSIGEYSQNNEKIINRNKEKDSGNSFDMRSNEDKRKEYPITSSMEEVCLYFEPDNERYLKFTNFLKSYEKELNLNKNVASFVEENSAEKPKPKTMAPPTLKRKLSSSPLSDILLHNANNNNDGNKEEESEVLEEGEPVAKRKKLGRPKKQRPSLSSYNPPGLLNGDNFVLPLSPESDVSATSEKIPGQQVKEEKSRQRNNQRYSSDDLYKPRPLFATSSRRNRRSNQA